MNGTKVFLRNWVQWGQFRKVRAIAARVVRQQAIPAIDACAPMKKSGSGDRLVPLCFL
jgi:hypothetical protein